MKGAMHLRRALACIWRALVVLEGATFFGKVKATFGGGASLGPRFCQRSSKPLI